MNHLTRDQLSALLDGALDARARADAERHLESCAACRETLAELAATDDTLRRALGHDPGEAYFETFPDRVARRLRAERAARPAPAAGWREWLAPRRLAWAGSAAALLVVAGIVFLQGREGRAPMERSDLAGRARQQETHAAGPEAPGPAMESAPAPTAMRAPAPGDSRAEEQESNEAAPTSLADGGALEPRERRDEGASGPAAAFAKTPTGASTATEGAKPAAPRTPVTDDERRVRPAPPARMQPSGRSPSGEEGAPMRKSADAPAPAPAPAATQATPREAERAPARSLMDQMRELKTRAARPLQRDSTGTAAPGGGAQGFAVSPQAGAEGLWHSEWQGATDAWPPEVLPQVRSADSLEGLALRRDSAHGFDSAAAGWAAIRARVAPGGRADAEARAREADARWYAWTIQPTPPRRSAAQAALERALALPRDEAATVRFRGLLGRLR